MTPTTLIALNTTQDSTDAIMQTHMHMISALPGELSFVTRLLTLIMSNSVTTIAKTAAIIGNQLAYPNGIPLKYE